jgi:hypothetical protein
VVGTRRSSQLPSAVLLPHDRRDGVVALPEGTEMVMPGDNVAVTIELIHADCHGGEASLRHPRGRPHGRCRSSSPQS